MDIRILQLVEGAQQARGLTVVIDVFRAFTVAAYVFNNGAKCVIPVGELELAYEIKAQNPSFLLIGERNGEAPAGFDFGNSPTEVERVDFTDQTVIQTTSAGTQGVANAHHADEIITGSFVNAPAIVSYIQARRPRQVSLVCMGNAAVSPSDEDTLCAQFIKDSLQDKITDFEQIRNYLREYHSAQKFFNTEKEWAPQTDFDLCLDLGRFSFVLQVSKEPGWPTYLRRIDVQLPTRDL
jgi:2-phosphosulfolactate phosphatase